MLTPRLLACKASDMRKREGECATSDIAVVDERAVVDAKASVTNDPIYLW